MTYEDPFEETLFDRLEGLWMKTRGDHFVWSGYDCHLSDTEGGFCIFDDGRKVGVLFMTPNKSFIHGYDYRWEVEPSRNDLMKLRLVL